MKPELKAWLETVAPHLDKDVRKGLEAELEKDEVATKIRETVLARSDYSRAMDELRKQEEQAELKRREADALIQANVKWKQDYEPLYAQALQDKKVALAEAEAHRARIKALAEAGLIDPADATVKFESPVAPKTNGQAEPQYLTPKQMQDALAQKEREFAFALANFGDLADEHFSLFGERLKRQDLIQEVMKSGKTLEEAWEQKYNVPQKRQELEQGRISKMIEDARAEERAKVLSERTVDPGFHPRPDDGADKHILSLFNSTQGQPSSVSDAVRAATAAYERGDFRVPQPQPTK